MTPRQREAALACRAAPRLIEQPQRPVELPEADRGVAARLRRERRLARRQLGRTRHFGGEATHDVLLAQRVVELHQLQPYAQRHRVGLARVRRARGAAALATAAAAAYAAALMAEQKLLEQPHARVQVAALARGNGEPHRVLLCLDEPAQLVAAKRQLVQARHEDRAAPLRAQ